MTLSYIIAGILAVLGQLSDAITTQIALAHGGTEANPFMIWVTKHLLVNYSLKVGFPIIVWIMCQKHFAPRKFGVGILMVPAITGFGAALWNLMVIRYLSQ